jgi:predicted RNA binding protein YcfA (HicA-like mRNA interferase family)
MGKLGKLVEQFLANPPEVRFDDVCYILTAFGFEEKRSKGSHHTFVNADGLNITVPKKSGKRSIRKANCCAIETGGMEQ